jgi:hypothetical protein
METSLQGAHSLPYEEPSLVTTLTVASFLLFLPVSKIVLDRFLYVRIRWRTRLPPAC